MKQFDFKQVALIVGGFQMTGFVDGTAITVERNEDAFALRIGADGEGTRAKSNNKSGRFTFTLQQASSSNSVMSGFALADELSNGGVVPVLLKDNNGLSIYAAEQAWVVKRPSAEFGNEESDREWVLETDSLKMFDAGL